METLDALIYSIKQKPVGSFIGGVSVGMLAYKAGVKNKLAIVAFMLMGGLLGSSIEHKLTEKSLPRE